jgi:predicted nucleic acid-binding protein
LAPPLTEVIPPGAKLLIDTSTILSYLSGSEPASATATRLFDDFLATGRDRGAISTVSVGEILVRPFQAGPAAVAIAEGFLGHFADLDLIDIDYPIAREAARIRATTGLRMPDALILATALVRDVDLLCTNDRGQALAADRLGIDARLLIDVPAE